MGRRITNLSLKGKTLDPNKLYRVAGWAPVSENASAQEEQPIWDLMSEYLKDLKIVKPLKLDSPNILGVENNPGYTPKST